jgi:hypothetical protein
MTVDVDSDTFYAVGGGLFELADEVYDAFAVNVQILGGTGAMAGTDDAGTAWATSYDSRAREVLGAVNDLTAALQNYGGIVIQAGYNHAVAEYNATANQRGEPPQRPPEPASTTGVLSTPPSAGGPGKGLFDNALGLVEQVGVPVPDGDTVKVDTAAQAWDRLATVYQTTTVVEALEVNARAFSDTHSPEVQFIVWDLRDLRDATSAILAGCNELAQSCKDYRAALDDLRTQLEGILTDLAVELAIGATITIFAACVSFGVGAVAGAAKTAHTISKFAKTIRSAISAWKMSKRISAGVKKAHDIAGVRKRLERITNLARKANPEEPRPGLDLDVAGKTPLTAARTQIEQKFKHAVDFGVTEPRGRAGFDAFENAIKHHVDDPSTLHIEGLYRGDAAIFNYNATTGLVVVQSTDGAFVSGWRVTETQARYILEQGKLGGG